MVQAGSVFLGAVEGGGGVADFASGTGTISNFGSFNFTVSGSMAPTVFTDFHTLEVGAGAVFTLAGATAINSGVIETIGGSLIVAGAVSGAGSAKIVGGVLTFNSTFSQSVSFGSSGTLVLAKSQTYGGTITGFSRAGKTSLDLLDIGFVGSGEASFSGTSSGGTLTVTDGTHTAHIALKGNYLGSTFVASSDGHGGTIVIDPRKAPAPRRPAQRFSPRWRPWARRIRDDGSPASPGREPFMLRGPAVLPTTAGTGRMSSNRWRGLEPHLGRSRPGQSVSATHGRRRSSSRARSTG